MLSLKLSWILSLVSVHSAFAEVSSSRCAGGGEGGVPFVEVSGVSTLDWRPVQSAGNIEELIVSQNSPELIYRNSAGEVWEHDLKHGPIAPRIWNVFSPLSRVFEPQERFLANETRGGQLWTYDRKLKQLSALDLSVWQSGAQLLFWHDSSAYFAAHRRENDGGLKTDIVRANRLNHRVEVICKIAVPEHWGEVRFARGSRFPNATLYSPEPKNLSRGEAQLYLLDVRTCKMQEVAETGPDIDDSIVDVVETAETSAYALILPKNMVWWDSKGCKIMDTKGLKVFFPNPAIPLLLGWTPGGSLSLLDPKRETSRPIAKGIRIGELDEKRTGVRGKDLFAAPILDGEHWRALIRVDLSVE